MASALQLKKTGVHLDKNGRELPQFTHLPKGKDYAELSRQKAKVAQLAKMYGDPSHDSKS